MRKSIFEPKDYETRDAVVAIDDGLVDLRRVGLREDDGEFDGIPGYDGYVITWNTVDSYGTFFTKGAAKKTLAERADVAPVLWQHWPDQPIGTHLSLKEDKYGVFARTKLIEGVQAADETLALMRGGVKLGLSFGFKTVKERPATEEDEIDFSVAPEFKKYPREELRAISEFALWETSPVTFAANEKAAPSHVRELADADSLNFMLDAIRTGRLTNDQYAQIVAAWGERAGAGITDDHSTPEQARRNRDIEAALTLAKYGGFLSGVPI